jgi:uncharacterized protein YjbI with pentapeptide repeats
VNTYQRGHDEASSTIRRVMMVLVGYSFFCLLMLGQPDAALLSTDAEINVPFANTKISFVAFLLVGPLILVSIVIYLHIFVGQWIKFGGRDAPDALPFLFNMDSWLAHAFTEFIFYWLVPSILLLFTWKSLPRPEAPLLVLSTAVALFILTVVRIVRLHREGHWLPIALLGVIPLGILSGVSFVVVQQDLRAWLLSRPLELQGADLSGRDLRGFNLRDANLREANLQHARLDEADLRVADLTDAVLDNAGLERADLRGANLTRASVREADMSEAQLQDAKVTLDQFQPKTLRGARLAGLDLTGWVYSGRDLGGASLIRTNLTGSDLSGSNLAKGTLNGAKLDHANLDRTNLTGANLSSIIAEGASFVAANLAGAILPGAFLMEAKLNGADLSGSILVGANLRFAELVGSKTEKANLRGAALSSSDLRGADFHLAKMEGAILHYAKAQGARFELAHLEGVGLGRADLRGANFNRTLLILADLRATKVEMLPTDEVMAIRKKIPWQNLSPDRKTALTNHLDTLDDHYVPPIRENAALAMIERNAYYRDWQTPTVSHYYAVLASCLSAVACEGEHEAKAIFKRVTGDWTPEYERELRPRLAQALIDQSCEVIESIMPQHSTELEALIAGVSIDRRNVVDINDAFTIARDQATTPAAGPCIATQ